MKIIDFQKLIEDYQTTLAIENMSKATIEAYTCDAKQYIEHLEKHSISSDDMNSFSDLDSYKASLIGKIGDNSLRRKVISLKNFIQFALKSEFNINFQTPSLIPSRLESQAYNFNDKLIERAHYKLEQIECNTKRKRDIALFNLLALKA